MCFWSYFFGFPSALQLSLNQRLNKFKQSCLSVLNQSEMAFKEYISLSPLLEMLSPSQDLEHQVTWKHYNMKAIVYFCIQFIQHQCILYCANMKIDWVKNQFRLSPVVFLYIENAVEKINDIELVAKRRLPSSNNNFNLLY